MLKKSKLINSVISLATAGIFAISIPLSASASTKVNSYGDTSSVGVTYQSQVNHCG